VSGVMTVMVSELVVADVLVDGVTRCLEAALSTNAVEDKSGGLVQPELRGNKFAIMLLATSMFDQSAGLNRLAGVHLLLASLPPLVSNLVAVALCPALQWVQVALVWPHLTLNPCNKQ
jgi:hypothetical protein